MCRAAAVNAPASGGTAYGTIVSGGFLSAYGGAISGAVIHDGSGQIFGTVQDMTLHSGYVWFRTGCIADGVTVSGGRVETSNAEIHNLTIHSGGTGTIGAGTLYDTKLLGGNVSIFHVEQTDFHRMTISGGTALIESRTALRDTVLQDGVLNLRNISGSGNGAFDTIVEGGSMMMSSGAVAAGTILSGGSMVLLEGAVATGTILRGGSQILAGAAENGALLSGGTQFVSSGIAVSDTRLSGGMQIVSSRRKRGRYGHRPWSASRRERRNRFEHHAQQRFPEYSVGRLLRDGSINNRALLSLASGAETAA